MRMQLNEAFGSAASKDSCSPSAEDQDLPFPISHCEPRVADEVTYSWKDITQEFVDACSQLKLGELFHDADFGLLEGMSAIEMMDPKMDAGMVCNQTKRKVLNFQQAIQANTIKLDGLTPQEIIGIIDDTLACVVTWLEGHSMVQTVFINLYLHDPNLIVDRTLRSFSICVLRLVDLIRDRINRASVFEEEDFQSLAYSFRMAGDVADSQASGSLKEVEEELMKVIKSTRVRSGVDRNSDTELKHENAVALHARLKFTRLFFLTVLAFSQEKCQGLENAEKFLKQMKELIGVMKTSIELGIQPVDNDDGDCNCIMGFEPLVNQRLLPPTFPRYTKIRSRVDTMEYLDSMMTRLIQICSITQLSNFHDILDFFIDFSQTSPCLLSRSLLQLTALPVHSNKLFGTQKMVDVLRDTVRSFCAPPVLMPKCPIYNNASAKECVDSFLSLAVRPLVSVMQISGHNRARQRDKWGHLLEEFGTLQDEAEKLDAYLHNCMMKVDSNWHYRVCFGTWVLYHTLKVMIQYLLAGFELELYSVHEYHYLFWYLCEGLYNWLISTINRAETFLVEHETMAADVHKGRGGKKNKKKKKTRVSSVELTLTQALHSLCSGYYKAAIGLKLDGKLLLPKYDFDCEEVRYNHRFAPFGSVATPPPMHYVQFKEMTDIARYIPPLDANDLYNGASKCFQQARLHLETLQNQSTEVQNLVKIAKTNLIVMKLLIGGHKKDTKMPPEFDFSQHCTFPMIRLP